jgi:hypothetical protein
VLWGMQGLTKRLTRRLGCGGTRQGHLRGVRLLCLEKAYIFTQYLMRGRLKRMLLRAVYAWGSLAAARRLGEEAALAALPAKASVEAASLGCWTGPLEDTPLVAGLQARLAELEQQQQQQQQQGGQAASERQELVMALAICRARAQALEGKVEELMAVEAAYRHAGLRLVAPGRDARGNASHASQQPEPRSPCPGADSTMASLRCAGSPPQKQQNQPVAGAVGCCDRALVTRLEPW